MFFLKVTVFSGIFILNHVLHNKTTTLCVISQNGRCKYFFLTVKICINYINIKQFYVKFIYFYKNEPEMISETKKKKILLCVFTGN